MSEALATTEIGGAVTIIETVVDSVQSPHSKRAYNRALVDFLTWYKATAQTGLSRATVQRYTSELYGRGLSAANINQRLSAIRKLAVEASQSGILPGHVAEGIRSIKGLRQEGHRAGNWLGRDQAQRLINVPDTDTLKGLRDRAVLAVLVGCGLRRAEVARLTLANIQQREGRWVIVDLVGKGNKWRSVPMPSWAKVAIDAWTLAAAISEGRLFRSINKGGRLSGESMTPQAIADVVKSYADQVDVDELAAHDLRRTFAKLARKGGAALEQIQLSLGHEKLDTTQRYLGIQQDLVDAPCDRLGLRLEG